MSPALIAEKMSLSAASSPIGVSGVQGGSRSSCDLQRGDLEQRRVVEQSRHLVDVLPAEGEALLQLREHRRVGVGLHLEPDDRLEAALLQLALDERPLALAVGVLVEFDLGVAADAEQARALDHHPRKELRRVRGDHLVEADEDPDRGLDAAADTQPLRELAWHLDANEHRLVAHGIGEAERPRRGEIRDVRGTDGRRRAREVSARARSGCRRMLRSRVAARRSARSQAARRTPCSASFGRMSSV